MDARKLPRNLDQVNYVKRTLRNADVYDDIYEVSCFSDDYPEIVPGIGYKPDFYVIQLHPEMNNHVISLLRNFKYIVMNLDTTYDVGSFFTTILSVWNPLFKGQPVMPVAVMFHENTKGRSHHRFLEIVAEKLSVNNKKVIICTDREQSIRSAISQHLKQANNVLCWNHLRQVSTY